MYLEASLYLIFVSERSSRRVSKVLLCRESNISSGYSLFRNLIHDRMIHFFLLNLLSHDAPAESKSERGSTRVLCIGNHGRKREMSGGEGGDEEKRERRNDVKRCGRRD